MRRFKSLLCATLLTLSISSAALAGNISTGRTGNISTGAPSGIAGNISAGIAGIILYFVIP